MAEVKAWQVDVEFEQFRRGQLVNSEPTDRIVSLVAAGYMHEVVPVYVWTDAQPMTEDETADLFRAEDAPSPSDVAKGVASTRRTRKE